MLGACAYSRENLVIKEKTLSETVVGKNLVGKTLRWKLSS